jgi:hypothetical protein
MRQIQLKNCLVAVPASSHEDEVVRIVPDTRTGR